MNELVALTPDKNMEAAIKGILCASAVARHPSARREDDRSPRQEIPDASRTVTTCSGRSVDSMLML